MVYCGDINIINKHMEQTTNKRYFWMAGTLTLLCVSFASIAFGLNNLSERRHPNGQVASITVTGEGEVTAPPDIATITFTIRESAKTVPDAQKLVEKKLDEALKAIDALGVNKKDTKTLSYTINPKYESQGAAYCISGYCPPMKTVITGYEVAQSISVKVRKIDSAGEVLGAVGKANITEVSGPDFTVDDMDKPQAEAKGIAIEKAKAKAKVTANALGVSLGSIIQFSEDSGSYPMMYRAEAAMSVKAMGGAMDAVSLPQGESVIKKTVTITYELR